jgi:ABC-type branched-subunit amino acid transport system ATPase component
MLSVADLVVTYGGVTAVDRMTMEMDESSVHGLIGPNGAGKSTALNAMTGVTRPDGGSVMLDGRQLVGLSPASVLSAGVARTFQQARLWGGMTVLQNLTVPVLSSGRSHARSRAEEVATILGFSDLLDEYASGLAFGVRRLVEVGRAMMTEPRLMLLDEPGAGLTANEKLKLVDVLRSLAGLGTGVLLVDHDMDLVMRSCQRVTVLDAGSVIFEGTPDEVRSDERVLAIYLGGNT